MLGAGHFNRICVLGSPNGFHAYPPLHRFFISVALAVGLSSAAWSQQTYVVDSVGGSGAATSLTQLITTIPLQPGDTVQLIGRLDPVTGLPVPYSEAVGEIFPISLPPGIKVMSSPGTQAVIGSNGSTGTGPLLDCPGIGISMSQPTRIWDLWFVGGDPAISLEYNGQGGAFSNWIHVRDCRFIGSRVGVSAAADDGYTLNVQISNCDLVPQQPASMLATPVQSHAFEIGLKFHAYGTATGEGKVNAEVNGLDVIGDFSIANGVNPLAAAAWPMNLNQQPVPGGTESSLSREVGLVSRVIEVFSSRKGLPALAGPIPTVDLLLSGSDLDGLGVSTNTGGGWDIGVLAMSESEFGFSPEGFASGFKVEVTGTHIERFRHVGVAAVSSAYAWGHLNLTGNTVVKHTGIGSSYLSPGFLGSGVYGYAYEGLLSITADECSFSDNVGHGVVIDSRANGIAGYEDDLGAFLGMEECKVHGNGGDGVSLYASWNWNDVSDQWDAGGLSAIVGGTFRHDSALTTSLTGSPDATTPVGQGYIRRCAISNNGGRGVFATATGASDPNGPRKEIQAVSLEIVNCAIWNNPLGGLLLYGDMNNVGYPSSGFHGPFLLVPLVHSTVAGNGSTSVDPWTGQSADYSVEVHEVTGYLNQVANRYRFVDPTGAKISARISNCILQRANPSHPDLGPTLNAPQPSGHGVAEMHNYLLVPETRVAVGGNRAQGVLVVGVPFLNQDAAPWGAITLSSRDETQFILLGSGPGGRFSETPNYLHAAVAASAIDFFGMPRDPLTTWVPGVPGTREKGYDEL